MGVPIKYDLTGKRIDDWIVIGRAPNNKNRLTKWLCRCSICGVEKIILGITLRKGKNQCKNCFWGKWENDTQPEKAAFLRYYPDADVAYPKVVYRLDGDFGNLQKGNLYLTTYKKLHYANLRLSVYLNGKVLVRYPMYGFAPELRDVRKTMLMLIDLEEMINKYESEF